MFVLPIAGMVPGRPAPTANTGDLSRGRERTDFWRGLSLNHVTSAMRRMRR